MSKEQEEVELPQKEYTEDLNRNAFIKVVMGGDYSHVGIYSSGKQSVEKACESTLKTMIRILPSIKKSSKILVINGDFGGTARFFAEKYNCKIDCLNPGKKQNAYNKKKIEKNELEDYVTITYGSFDHLPYELESFDIVICQETLMYEEDKIKLFRKIARICKPEGRFIFTDIMQKDDCDKKDLDKVLKSLELEKLETVDSYNRMARRADLERVYTREMPDMLEMHYAKLQRELDKVDGKLAKKTSQSYVDEKRSKLELIEENAKNGCLNWGILQFQKRND